MSKHQGGENSDDDDDGPPVDATLGSEVTLLRTCDEYTAASVDFGEKANAVVVGTPLGCAAIANVYLSTLGSVTSALDAANAAYEQMRKVGRCDVYLFEEQPPINTRTRMLETGMASLAKWSGAVAIHVPVSRIVSMFELPVGNHAKKKEAATRIAQEYIDGKRRRIDGSPMISVPSAIASGFERLRRKHDVADALLQFAWYVQVGRKELAPLNLGPGSSARATDPKNKTAEKRRAKLRATKKAKASSDLVKKRPNRTVVSPPKKRRRRDEAESEENIVSRPRKRQRKKTSKEEECSDDAYRRV